MGESVTPVLLLRERVAGVAVLELRERDDVAGSGLRHVHVLRAAHQQQLADALLAAARRVGERAVGMQRAGHDADHRERAGVAIGHRLEDARGERLARAPLRRRGTGRSRCAARAGRRPGRPLRRRAPARACARAWPRRGRAPPPRRRARRLRGTSRAACRRTPPPPRRGARARRRRLRGPRRGCPPRGRPRRRAGSRDRSRPSARARGRSAAPRSRGSRRACAAIRRRASKLARSRSSPFTKAITGTPARSAARHMLSVPTFTPSTAETTSSAPSRAASAIAPSPWKFGIAGRVHQRHVMAVPVEAEYGAGQRVVTLLLLGGVVEVRGLRVHRAERRAPRRRRRATPRRATSSRRPSGRSGRSSGCARPRRSA